ncbi:MAG TPA: M43 family zinc metalloprotease [Bacteroidia bacterium]|jgi:PKD repeat protein|nr:M43 family zinc metalloprotease [Bacteroidia bacterium]
MKSNNFLRILTTVIFATSISFNQSYGQLSCGTDIMTQQLLKLHPELLEKYNQYETYTKNYVNNYMTQKLAGKKKAASSPTKFIVPIVFHILHENGPENISDAQILDEMRILNEDWGHTNPDTNDAITAHFRAIEGNNQVEFRLAQIDPKGNCTNGIDRIYTNRTEGAGDLSKLNQWPPSKYVNVWVCKSIGLAGAAGYAYFPWEVDGYESPNDGVLIINSYIGSIGTSSPLTSRALTHEIGHVMNLEHPWGFTNDPGVACGDDNVDDTPETKGWKTCPGTSPADSTKAKICDTVKKSPLYVVTENYQNFMDYSYCSMMFTEGQQARIWAALNSTAAGRNNLWDTANLIATGVYTPPVAECVPMADFYSNVCMVCQGTNVDFYDNSGNATPASWLWTFTGTSVNNLTQRNPIVSFDSIWRQSVTLTVSNSAGQNAQTKSGYIYVSPLWSSYYGTYSEGFENPTEIANDWVILNQYNNSTSWHYTNSASSIGSGSLELNAFSPIIYLNNTYPPEIGYIGAGAFDVDDAITPSINLETASAMTLSFDYSCATRATSVADLTETLEIDYSLTCGAKWIPIKTISGATLTNAGDFQAYYTPASAADWQHMAITLSSIMNDKPNVRFRFRYTSGTYSNNLYIDNVNLTGTVGVETVSNENYQFVVYPNPMSNAATVSYYLPNEQLVNIGLFDVTGREITELSNSNQVAGHHTFNLNNENLSNGIYFIKLVSGNSKSVTQKLIVIK